MDTFIPLSAGPTALSLPARGLYLAITTRRETAKATELIAGLALRGPLRVVAGSEWVPNYEVARLLRRSVTQVEAALGQIHLARAFTCYQLLDLLAGIRPEASPVLVLDMLHSFQVDDIPLEVRLRTLEKCGAHLQRLALSRPVAVLVRSMPSPDYPRLYSMLAALADEIYQPVDPAPAVSQPALF